MQTVGQVGGIVGNAPPCLLSLPSNKPNLSYRPIVRDNTAMINLGAAVSASFLFIVGLANSIILFKILRKRRRVSGC